jgi:hypothetical protein
MHSGLCGAADSVCVQAEFGAGIKSSSGAEAPGSRALRPELSVKRSECAVYRSSAALVRSSGLI